MENILSAEILLKALTSSKEIEFWAKHHRLSNQELYQVCLGFIRRHILSNVTDSYLILFTNSKVSISQEHYRRHYRLLISIFHPDKTKADYDYERCTKLIINAYQEVKKSLNKTSPHTPIVENNFPSHVKRANTVSKKSTNKKVRVQLKKVPHASKKRHPYLILSFIFVCFAFILAMYISLQDNAKISFYKKTNLLSSNALSQLDRSTVNNTSQPDLSPNKQVMTPIKE